MHRPLLCRLVPFLKLRKLSTIVHQPTTTSTLLKNLKPWMGCLCLYWQSTSFVFIICMCVLLLRTERHSEKQSTKGMFWEEYGTCQRGNVSVSALGWQQGILWDSLFFFFLPYGLLQPMMTRNLVSMLSTCAPEASNMDQVYLSSAVLVLSIFAIDGHFWTQGKGHQYELGRCASLLQGTSWQYVRSNERYQAQTALRGACVSHSVERQYHFNGRANTKSIKREEVDRNKSPTGDFGGRQRRAFREL